MADSLKVDYDVLNDAKRNAQRLAEEIGPLLDHGLFNDLATGYDAASILGSPEVATAVTGLRDEAEGTLGRAHDGLMKLGDAFGSVGEAFLSFDSELAQGMGVMGANLGLGNYLQQKAQWDYRQAHLDQCVPGPDGSMPDFCSATDPGAPPVDQTIITSRGSVHTHLTLDDQGHVIREDSTVTYDGKTYTTSTTYSDNGNSYVTDTTYPDGSTVHSVTHVNDDGSGTMTVTNSDGDTTDFTRGPRPSEGANPPDWQARYRTRTTSPTAPPTARTRTIRTAPGAAVYRPRPESCCLTLIRAFETGKTTASEQPELPTAPVELLLHKDPSSAPQTERRT